MKYLVSIENSQYFQWQIDLLIESFKMHGLQDDLIIGVASKKEEIIGYCKNLVDHPHKFQHTNLAPLNPYLNKTFCALTAFEAGLIGDSFTIIEPDMVLVKPIPVLDNNITFSVDFDFTQDRFTQMGYGFVINDIKQILADNGILPSWEWIYLGGIMQFNNVDANFLRNVLFFGQEIERKFRENNNTKILAEKRYVDKAAWMMGIFSSLGVYFIRPKYNYESHMLDWSLTKHFIHYSHGVPPVFNKRLYFSDPKVSISMHGKSPFEVIKETSVTPAVDYVKDVVLSVENN